MNVSVEWARERAEAVLRSAGLDEDQAALVVDAMIEAELRGRPTHGLMRLPLLLGRLEWMERRPIRVEVDRGAAVLVDGGMEIGYLVSDFCARLVIERCRKHGLALVAAHNTTHAGMLGYFAEPIARADLVGVCFTNCVRKTAPAGATEAVFGTNPLAVAIPTDADPILLDFATSAVSIGDLLVAAQRSETIPEDVAYDADGRPTTDPEAARRGAVLAFGGHKGSGLALVIHLMSTAFTGAAVFPTLGRDYGYVAAACDPYLFVSREAFQRSVRELIGGIKSARRAPGVGEVLLPGERSFRARAAALEAGLELDEQIVAVLDGSE